jgi:hypothetical protein
MNEDNCQTFPVPRNQIIFGFVCSRIRIGVCACLTFLQDLLLELRMRANDGSQAFGGSSQLVRTYHLFDDIL